MKKINFNSIIDFIVKNWKLVLGIICLLTILSISQCTINNVRKNEKVLYEQELKDQKATIEREVRKAMFEEMIAFEDSVVKAEEKKSQNALKQAEKYRQEADKYKKKGDKLQKKVDDLLAEYGDSIDDNCKQIVGAYQEQVDNQNLHIDAQQEEINELNLVIDADSITKLALNKIIDTKDSIIVDDQKLIQSKDESIESLRKQLGKQNGFFKKNKGWISAGLGFILGYLVFK